MVGVSLSIETGCGGCLSLPLCMAGFVCDYILSVTVSVCICVCVHACMYSVCVSVCVHVSVCVTFALRFSCIVNTRFYSFVQPVTVYTDNKLPFPIRVQLLDSSGSPSHTSDIRVHITKDSKIKVTPTSLTDT